MNLMNRLHELLPPRSYEQARDTGGQADGDTVDFRPFREFARLTKRANELAMLVSVIEERLKALQEPLQNEFAKGLTKGLPVEGVTVYLERRLWGSYPKGRPAAVEALKAAGGGWEGFAKLDFNHQSLTAALKEAVKPGGDGLPPEFEGTITTSEKFTVKARQA